MEQSFAGIVTVVAIVVAWQVFKRSVVFQKARITGGSSPHFQRLLQRMPLLYSCPRLNIPSLVQLGIYAVQMMWQEWRFDSEYDFVEEVFEVALPGESAESHVDDVTVKWLLGYKGGEPRELPLDAPVVILTPGLNCYIANLPGTSIYNHFLKQPWRIGVFEKRGVGGLLKQRLLKAPTFHMFGHTSDLHTVLKSLSNRWPEAPFHLVGMSSGNGLSASYLALHGPELPQLRSCLLLIGGEDYNMAFSPPRSNWLTKVVFDWALLPTSKHRMLERNETVLRKHNAKAYEEALKASTMQEFYDICMRHFSGYTDRAEAECRINPFGDGTNKCMLSYTKPCMVIFAEDDPVAPGGPRPSWVDTLREAKNAALAIYPTGSHLACFDSWCLSRWIDRLAVDWINSVHAMDQE